MYAKCIYYQVRQNLTLAPWTPGPRHLRARGIIMMSVGTYMTFAHSVYVTLDPRPEGDGSFNDPRLVAYVDAARLVRYLVSFMF